MASVDELLGRLETQSSRPELTRGGVPQLTPQDIAAALGMCENKRAVAVYQAFIGECATAQELDRIVAEIQWEEWRNRADRLVEAQLAEAAATIGSARAERAQRAKLMMAGAKAAIWPPLIDHVYAAMRHSLINEIRSPKICPMCNGRKSLRVENLVVDCTPCGGTGRTSTSRRISDRKRALEMGIPHTSYQRTWGKVYEWTSSHIQDLIAEGRDEFKAALERAA